MTVHPRHCERSEAIHLSARGPMDCFASLAMTKYVNKKPARKSMRAGRGFIPATLRLVARRDRRRISGEAVVHAGAEDVIPHLGDVVDAAEPLSGAGGS